MSKFILFALLVAFVFTNNVINIKYRTILSGEEPLKDLQARKMYLEFQGQYPKNQYRFGIFLRKLREIIQHNSEGHSWAQAINEFSDMTFEEFTQLKLMAPQECSATNRDGFKLENVGVGIPDAYEWNSLGVVTPVKNQGSCGSCWTFSTVGAMEAHWNILGKGKNLIFSEQQLVDCAGDFDNHGCNGGLPSHAFEYIKYGGALELNSTYPYTGKQHKTCNYNISRGVAYVKHGSYNITRGDQVELADRLYNIGPISVAFKVINNFNSYSSGVYSSNRCGSTPHDVNHAVLATGYGVQNGKPFWNIKNSWGPSWGLKGYFKLLRGQNMCAIAQCNAYPLIDNPV